MKYPVVLDIKTYILHKSKFIRSFKIDSSASHDEHIPLHCVPILMGLANQPDKYLKITHYYTNAIEMGLL